MNIQEIDIGTAANSGNGDDARTWASKTNANFTAVVSSVKIKIGNYYVQKNTGNTDLNNLEVGDKFEGWLASDTRYVIGKVIALPFDVDDTAKTKLIVNNYI